MTCCVCSLWCSKSWILLIVPIFAVFASFSSKHDAFFTSITLSSLLVLISTFVFFKLSKQNPITVQENPKPLPSYAVTTQEKLVKENEEEFFIQQQDFYSENESLGHFSTTSSEEDHSSNAELKRDYSDGSISDEESLIEIEIPSGEFLLPKKDSHFNFKCCKLSTVQSLDFFTEMNNEMNEEDNLIEIDIYMGSIKYPSMVFS